MSPQRPEPVPLESTRRLGRVMRDYFTRLDEAARSDRGKVAWCSSFGPSELLIALGFEVFYPENHGAMLGATRTAVDLIPLATAQGYSTVICSYLTSDIGASLAGFTPLTRAYGLAQVPRPDVLVYNTSQCREVQDWFAFYARAFDVPLLGVQSPRGLPRVESCHVQDVKAQLEELIPPLERIAGRHLEPDRLRQAVRLSKECTLRYQKLLQMAAHRPAPLTFFDHCIHMAPAVVLRGRPEAPDYYDHLLDELAARVARGLAAVPGEQSRLYWDGMPIWGRLRMLSDLFRELKAAVVASTYCNSWVFPALQAERPLESMARAALECFNVRDEAYKERYILDWVEGFHIHGVVFHDARTCPYLTNSRFGLPKRLQDEHGLPTLVIDGDLNDLRCFSDEQAKTNIEAFLEDGLAAGVPPSVKGRGPALPG